MPIILALDQGSKALVRATIPLFGSYPVVHGFFRITHIRNTGAAFGLLGGDAGTVRTAFFVVVTIGAVVLIFSILRRIKENRFLVPLCLTMIMAGAIGNLVDRINLGYVTDFLDFYWRGYHWPAFNVADSAITIGIGLLIVENLLFRREPERVKRDDQQ
ncbi:MAG: signal peptidase II [Deltaproteobacteria bacterium]|nr:signal peptidase II [Deltaproteobacteria bacterium]